LDEGFDRDMGLLENPTESAHFEFSMIRYDATIVCTPHDDMAAAWPHDRKSKALQGFHGLR
jgi:hypothetical protein